MKFVVDHQLPPDLARWLFGKGYQAEHVYALGLDAVDDAVIWEWALAHSAIIITKDADFARRRVARADGPTVVWLRIGNAATGELLRWLESRWSGVAEQVEKRRAVIEVR